MNTASTSRWGRVKRAVLLSGVAAVAAGGIVLASPTAASASGCDLIQQQGVTGGRAASRCPSLGYWTRVVLTCEENSGNRYWATGEWVISSTWSWARCDEFAWLVQAAIEIDR